MRKLFFAALLLSFVACKSSKDEWNKEALVEKCKKNVAKDKNLEAQLKNQGIEMTADQIAKICDCSADAVLAKYKTKAEADKDVASVDAMGSECASNILMPDVNMPDSTVVSDSTDQ